MQYSSSVWAADEEVQVEKPMALDGPIGNSNPIHRLDVTVRELLLIYIPIYTRDGRRQDLAAQLGDHRERKEI